MQAPESQEFYKKMGVGFVETSSGAHFNLDEPDFRPEDIAHALSMNCRFNGHVRQFYSVAEHSLLVSALVYHMGGNQQQCLEALLHDATEAYLSDVPAPFKQFLPDWRAIDAKLDAKLREWAGLPSDKTGLVKDADWLALFIEAYHLLPDGGECFLDPGDFRPRAMRLIEEGRGNLYYMTPSTARSAFLGSWLELAEEGGYDNSGVARQGVA
jgi:hypothetical protein